MTYTYFTIDLNASGSSLSLFEKGGLEGLRPSKNPISPRGGGSGRAQRLDHPPLPAGERGVRGIWHQNGILMKCEIRDDS
jgi:hypothetical protein